MFARLVLLFALVLAISAIGSEVAFAKQPDVETFIALRPRDARSQRPPPKTNLLAFGGGAVQTSTKLYISYWGVEWAGGFTTGGFSSVQAQTYVEGFFSNVGGRGWIANDDQYCQNVPNNTTNCATIAGAVNITNPTGQFGGSWYDLTPVPARPTQADIAAAALRLRAQYPGADDANATYMVFTPHGKSMNGFGTQWCAWHSSTTAGTSKVAYAYIPYLPDAGGSCGMNFVNSNGYFDGFSIVAGHEYEEAKSDPFPSTGWVDSSGQENADKCAWNSLSGNIFLGGNNYAVQPLWSNQAQGCVVPTS